MSLAGHTTHLTCTFYVALSSLRRTTFLEDVRKSHKCTYIRQYHTLRPYIIVSRIPNFDPSQLPYWDVYVNEGKANTIKAGGTMAGEFTAGLSGGQRKLLLFELIYQRTKGQRDLLIALDEPFCGVTDDFLPFIVKRLEEMKDKFNLLLVTNDHVDKLTHMADNTIRVSALDRSTVSINQREKVDREKAILALSLGDEYVYTTTTADLKFFFDVEVYSNGALLGIAVFSIFCNILFIATFWGSNEDSAALVLVAGGIIAFFCVQPYLLSLVDWRNAMLEEAEALVHASKGMNKALKSVLTLLIIIILSALEFGVVNAVINGLSDVKFWVGMLFDSASLTFPPICLGLYTRLPFQAVEILGGLPFLLMIFLSTTFSPGSGVPVLKELRYLFSRFYFWCMVPGVKYSMENCPPDETNLLYLVLSGFLGVVVFLCFMGLLKIKKKLKAKEMKSKRASMIDTEFHTLQIELYGEKVLQQLQHAQTSISMNSVSAIQNESTTNFKVEQIEC